MDGPSLVQGLLQRVEHEAGLRSQRRAPADDTTGISVDDVGDVDEARPDADIGEVGELEPVGRRSMEDPVHMIERARRRLVRHCGAHGLATNDALQPHAAHQSRHGAARHVEAFAHHLPPDLPHAINLEVLGEDAGGLGLQGDIPLRPH